MLCPALYMHVLYFPLSVVAVVCTPTMAIPKTNIKLIVCEGLKGFKNNVFFLKAIMKC